jgi:hypothetical protein
MRHFEPIKPKRRTMRAIRPRPFLHQEVPLPMWTVLILVVIWVQSVFDHPIFSLITWIIILAAAVQWLWWGRRP